MRGRESEACTHGRMYGYTGEAAWMASMRAGSWKKEEGSAEVKGKRDNRTFGGRGLGRRHWTERAGVVGKGKKRTGRRRGALALVLSRLPPSEAKM